MKPELKCYRFLETGHGRHVETGDDGHQRVKVADVEALPRHFDEVLDHLDPLLLLHVLIGRETRHNESTGPNENGRHE